MTILTIITLISWIIAVGCIIEAVLFGYDLLFGGAMVFTVIGIVLSYIDVAVESGWF